ncbi:MAG: hypothetical protein IJT94_08245 [Oscillibacter sp.]|nr:hypothetical protein [Oscillibacter sp.]
MDRRALLLYLQNVRDLEVVRARLVRRWRAYLLRVNGERYIAEDILEPWNEVDERYFRNCERAAGILGEFYSMDLLAEPCRNLASVVYIYDHMSKTRATLEETLLHERTENDLQELKYGMDRIFNRLDGIVYVTRCTREENRARVEWNIRQNGQMLKQLESMARNSQEAAQYARLADGYSRANVYFSLAEVWR